jgi:alkylhydroperoxidase/carboxymuconolactone decarboxylase family protein YurZ
VSRLPLVPEKELDPVARDALASAALELGVAPAPLRALAAAPRVLSAFWKLAETVLLEGSVPRTTKALVALAATAASPGAESLAAAFRGALEAQGLDRLVLEDLERRGESIRLPERTQRVLGFARRAALQPAQLTDEDWKVLRREGLGDGELAELVGLGAGLAGLIALARATREA